MMLLTTEFEKSGNGSYYFRYVTDKVRIEANENGMTVEDKSGSTIKIDDPFQYLDDDLYFQLGITDLNIEITKKAVSYLKELLS